MSSIPVPRVYKHPEKCAPEPAPEAGYAVGLIGDDVHRFGITAVGILRANGHRFTTAFKNAQEIEASNLPPDGLEVAIICDQTFDVLSPRQADTDKAIEVLRERFPNIHTIGLDSEIGAAASKLDIDVHFSEWDIPTAVGQVTCYLDDSFAAATTE